MKKDEAIAKFIPNRAVSRGKHSKIGFGGAILSGGQGGYGFGPLDQEGPEQLVRGALERGITLFDTAPVYGFGESEIQLGKALRSHRNSVILSSKGGVSWDDRKKILCDFSDRSITKMLHQSLNRLQTDYLDIYFVHYNPGQAELSNCVKLLQKHKKSGKIRWIGLSNISFEQIQKENLFSEIDFIQIEANFWNLPEVKRDQERFQKHGVKVISWGSLDQGFLAGGFHFDRKFHKKDIRSWAQWWRAKHANRQKALQKLEKIIKDRDITTLRLALSAVLGFDGISASLISFRNIAQLEKLLETESILLKRNEVEDIFREVFSNQHSLKEERKTGRSL